MTELTTEQFIYLLYAKAYAKATESGTVTGGDIKSYLTGEWKEKAEEIYSDLKTKGLIELKTKEGKPSKREGRFSLTDEGNQVLVTSLTTIDYDFTSFKSYKVLRTALACLLTHFEEAKPHEKMTFDEFQKHFKVLYFKERMKQSLQGVIVMGKRMLAKQFIEQHSISIQEFEKHFEKLRSEGEISMTEGREDKIIQWIE